MFLCEEDLPNPLLPGVFSDIREICRDALTPLPGDRVVLVGGEQGFCVEEFCEWLEAKVFFLPLSDKGERG